jgi:hypothetical protein
MAADTPQLQETKGSLVDRRLQGLTPTYRHDLASKLLFSATARIPADWVTNDQQRFLVLRADAVVGPADNAGALQVVDRVRRLCGELVPALIEDFLRTPSSGGADDAEQAYLHGSGAQVCEALFRTCAEWPDTDPRRLSPEARSAVHHGLHTALALRRIGRTSRAAAQVAGPPTAEDCRRWPVNPAGRSPAPDRHRRPGSTSSADEGMGPVLRADRAPTTGLDFEDRQVTRATSSDAMARRYDWLEARRHRRNLQNTALAAVVVLALPVVFVALLLGLRRFAPGLGVEQQTRIVVAAFEATTGLIAVAGAGLAGRFLWTRRKRFTWPGRHPRA